MIESRSFLGRSVPAWFCLAVALVLGGCGDDEPETPVDETGTMLYVANSGNNSVSVIDTESNSVVGTFDLPSAARTIRLHPFRSSFYIPLPDSNQVIKLLQRDTSILASIPTDGRTPYDLVFSGSEPSQDTSLAYVSLRGSNSVAVLRLAEDRLLTEIPVGRAPSALGLDLSLRGRIWVVNEQSSSVSVIDRASNEVVKTITVGTQPRDVTFLPSVRAYVSDAASDSVLAVRLDTLELDPNNALAAGDQPHGLVMRPSSSTLLVANSGDNTLLFIDTSVPATRSSLPTGAGPTEVVCKADGTRAYVANTAGNSVTVVDLEANQIVAEVPVGPLPTGLALY